MSLLRLRLLFSLGLALSALGGGLRADPAAPAPKAPADETAPAVFRINFETSHGPFVVEITRSQAPHGADRLFNLVKAKYFDGARFYRVVPGFVIQWGSSGDPQVTKAWDVPIPDDPVKGTNARGTITFAAQSEPNSRTTQLFINFADNAGLDGMGFAPLGRVVSGMDKVDQLYAGDGEKPDQGVIYEQGNAYLQKEFPRLDYIVTARLAP
jgi:peptidyl-prolyl cis-trans isomerase A (cyclophilin A)